MSDTAWLILIFVMVLLLFCGMNYFGIKYTQHSKKKRLWAGTVPILLSPILFFGLLSLSSLLDEGGIGTGFIVVILTSGFILNSVMILISAFFMPSKSY